MAQEKAGRNRSDYKKRNRGQTLKLIATGECANRSELVQALGLSKMAISKIVTEMIDQGLLAEEETRQPDPGRNPIGLKIAPSAPLVAGLAIHRGRCEAILCDLNLNVLQKEQVFYGEDMNQEKLWQYIFQIMDTLLYDKKNVVAIGAASVGPVSATTGTILKPYYFFGIENVPITDGLQERYHLPVFMDHDNQSAALAESLYGCGRGYSDILYVGIGSGVGCGIITNGSRYANRRGLPPEFGHVSIDVNGKPCACGSRGCIEAYLRTPELLKRLRYNTHKYYSYETFSHMREEPAVEKIFEEAIGNLAAAVVSTVNIMNSELIILGNDAVYWDDRYVQMLEDIVNERRFVQWDSKVAVRRAQFMEEAVLKGAACNAIEKLFQGQLIFPD